MFVSKELKNQQHLLISTKPLPEGLKNLMVLNTSCTDLIQWHLVSVQEDQLKNNNNSPVNGRALFINQNVEIMYQEFHSKTELYNLIKGKTLYIGISGNDGCIRITMAALKEYLKPRKYANGEVYIEDWYVHIIFKEYE